MGSKGSPCLWKKMVTIFFQNDHTLGHSCLLDPSAYH